MATEEQPVIVAAVGDPHVNDMVGLCPPAVTLDDGGTYRASKTQRALWVAWKEYWATVKDQADALGAKVYAVIGGDLNDRNVHDQTGLITIARADIIKMTVEALGPLLDVADRVFVVRGTEAHVGKRAGLEEEVAKDIEAVPDKEHGTHSWWWLRLEAEGVRFDCAHHPETFARRSWTEDAAAGRCAAIIRNRYWERDEKLPDIALRWHVHKFIPSGRRLKPQMFYCPSFSLNTPYFRRLGSTIPPQVGGLLFTCRGGGYEWEPLLWRVPRGRLKWWKES